MEHAKNFCFWERFANDRHRPTLDLHQKSAKKPEKLGNAGRCTSYSYLTHARKKVKNFFYIERYGNDLHRPTSFLFHRLEERSFSHTKQKHLQLLLYVNRHLPQAFSFIFVGFAPFQKATVTDRHKKRAKKPEKLGSDSRWHSYTVFTHARKKVKIFSI